MCGIVGIASAETTGFSFKELEAFETMLFLDTLRGWDSTGVFGVMHDQDVHIAKGAVHAPDFLKKSEWRDMRSSVSARGKFLVGHNRAATRGTVNDKNAHPFWVEDKIILVQNGTMRGSHKQHKDVEVDSEAIAHVLHETKDIEEALNKIDASYALVWYNVADKKLHLIRNKERPLYLAMTDKGSMWWASEGNTLLYAAARHDVKFATKPYPMDVDTLVTLELMSNRDFKISEKEIKIKPKEISQINFMHGRGHHYHGSGSYCAGEDDGHPFVFGGSPEANAILAATREVVTQQQTRTDKNSIVYSSAEIIVKHFPQWHMDVDVAREAMEEQSTGSKELTVELEDYYAANDNKDCNVFHVFGRNIDSSKSLIVYHWVVQEEDESTVLEMCSGGRYYTINSSTPTQRIFQHNGHKRSIVSCYGIGARLIYALPSEDKHNVQ